MIDVQTVLAAAQEAMGGEPITSSVETIDTLANCTGPSSRFSTRIYSARDGRMAMVQGGDSGRRLLAGIDVDDAWAYRPEEQSFSSIEAVSQTFLRGHELHMIALAPQTRFDTPVWQGETTSAGQAAVTLRFHDQLRGPLDIHYAQANGLPLGLTQVNHTGRGADTVNVIFADWQAQNNGLQLFTRATFEQGDDVYTYEFVRIMMNAVPDVLLQSPERCPDGTDAALLRHLHDQQQTAHLTHDAGLFASVFHDPITQANRGEIHQSSREDSQKRSQAYFDQVEFVAWEDITPPVIRVAQDGTMASILVHKRVHLAAEDAEGKRQEVETIFAWLESWEKLNGEWQLMMVVSTNN